MGLKLSTEARFFRLVDKNGNIPSKRPDLGPCWIWLGTVDDHGRGHFTINSREYIMAHQYLKGKAPLGLEWDHLCENTSCVNPDHTEAVTHKVNVQRGKQGHHKAFCKKGHPLIEGNVSEYITSSGRLARHCITCYDSYQKQYYLDHKRVKSS